MVEDIQIVGIKEMKDFRGASTRLGIWFKRSPNCTRPFRHHFGRPFHHAVRQIVTTIKARVRSSISKHVFNRNEHDDIPQINYAEKKSILPSFPPSDFRAGYILGLVDALVFPRPS